jgi:AraC family transcriptional regulator
MHLAGRPVATGLAGRERLLDLAVGLVEDIRSAAGPERPLITGFSPDFQLALPYRGCFVWHVGGDEVAGDANQALFVTGGERYRLSQPLAAGYAELIVTPAAGIIAELAHAAGADNLATHPLFRRRSRRLTPRLQNFRARFLSWASRSDQIDVLAAEEMVLALLRTALADDDAVALPRARPGRSTQRLIRRTKTFLEAEFARPIRLDDIGRAVGASPLYLTQIFRAIEGVPLHQYLTQLRLAHALEALPAASDLTQLAFDMGFSSHSHFTARFRQAFGTTPSRFRQLSQRRLRPAMSL